MSARIAWTLGIVLGATVARAAPVVSTAATGRLLYDTNLYLQDPAPLAPGQTRPALPANEADEAFDVLASVGFAWHPADGPSLELTYAPERVQYWHHDTEDHTDHTLTLAGSGKAAGWTGTFSTRYLYTDGSNESPIFNGLGGAPAIGGEPVRARRAQAISRASGQVSHPLGAGFVRGVFSVFNQQFHTVERNVPGYVNYADRDETSAGLDLGQPIAGSPLAFVVAGRAGFQRQANVLGVPLNYSNTFTRWLGGLEGSLGPTLKLAFLAGPEIHHYGDSVRSDYVREQRTTYAEGSCTWTPSRADTVTLTGKRYLWLPSGGRGAYAESVVDLTWKRKLSAQWSGSVGANFHDGDTSHFKGPTARHDSIYTGNASLSRSFSHGNRVELGIMHDRGVTFVPDTPARNYTRWIESVSVSHAW
ncbi:MAG TPA: hypothetical protein VHE61_05530 [Opitutaceae bacterium]|nr:hypothetical protein [Opitutaceae bacterium]